MSRARWDYTDRSPAERSFEGFDVEKPVPGYYRMKLRSGGVFGVVRIWWGPPADPITGEELDRSYRWQAAFNGELIDLERAWPACARMPATERDYQLAIKRQGWAKQHAPQSAYADPRTPLNPLDAPLTF
jgi:hypothetical protein